MHEGICPFAQTKTHAMKTKRTRIITLLLLTAVLFLSSAAISMAQTPAVVYNHHEPRSAGQSRLALTAPLTSVGGPHQLIGDDLFGMNYLPGFIPANTQGLRVSFSMDSSQVGFTGSGPGVWIATCEMLTLNAGSPDPYRLEPCISLWPSANCGLASACWVISLGWFDSSGNGHPNNVQYLYTYYYPRLSGTISAFYTGSAWTEQVYISQNGQTYSYNPPVSGNYVSTANNDWTSVETDPSQSGLFIYSGFDWQVTRPNFLVGGSWQTWNLGGSSYKELGVYAMVDPVPNTNNLGVAFMSTPGVNVQVGQSATNNQEQEWCISGNCPLAPSPLS